MLILVFGAAAEGFAITAGFSTEALQQDDIKTVLENINLTMLTEEPPKKAIECFDIDDGRAIAIGYSDFDKKPYAFIPAIAIFNMAIALNEAVVSVLNWKMVF